MLSRTHQLVNNCLPFASIAAFVFGACSFAASPVDNLEQQLENIEDIYRVELIAFARNRSTAMETEDFSLPPNLLYPERLAFLYEVDDEQQINSKRDPGCQPDMVKELSQPAELVNISIDKPPVDSAPQGLENNTGNVAAESQKNVPLPATMELLDESQFTLSALSGKLQRSREFRMLKHISWYQELGPRKLAPAIPLQGGEQYDDRYELEGSIAFSKGRYLHVTSNLWFSSFVQIASATNFQQQFATIDSDVQQLINNSVPLPPLPVRPERNIENTVNDECEPQIDEEPLSARYVAEQGKKEQNAEQRLKELLAAHSGKDLDIEVTEVGQPGYANENLPTPNIYRADSTVLLTEYRRMRSGEVHYLDHPRFGIIVSLTPLSQEWEEMIDKQDVE